MREMSYLGGESKQASNSPRVDRRGLRFSVVRLGGEEAREDVEWLKLSSWDLESQG